MRACEFAELDEIVNPVEREVQAPDPFTRLVAKAAELGTSGGGAYGRAIPDTKDPHMYRKELYGPSNLDKDAYYQYIKAASPYMGENPYFPRVYVIKLEKDTNGLIRPMYKMEKLYPGAILNRSARGRALIQSIVDRSFGPNIVTSGSEARWETVTNLLEDMMRFNLESYPDADPALIEAISLIKKLYTSDSDFDYDMHEGNAMYRLTSTGPQLVITDPLYERNFNSKVFDEGK